MRINAQGGDASMELELDNGERARIALRVRDGVAHVRVTGPASHAQLDDVMGVARIVEDAGLGDQLARCGHRRRERARAVRAPDEPRQRVGGRGAGGHHGRGASTGPSGLVGPRQPYRLKKSL